MSAMHGLGFHNMWGFSPCKNLLSFKRIKYHDATPTSIQQECTQDTELEPSESSTSVLASMTTPLNILLISPSDPRHIIKTIAKRFHSSSQDYSPDSHRPIHFYILESQAELIARHILLIHIFFDFEQYTIRHRASTFLQVFGNTLVTTRVHDYVKDCSRFLQELIFFENDTNKDKENTKTNSSCSKVLNDKKDGGLKQKRSISYQNMLANLLDYHHCGMKQSHRDAIEKVFESWWKNDDDSYNITELRDYRLRAYYGDRYDFRDNISDWDYHNRVKEIASIIHIQEFRKWRRTGIAFEIGDSSYYTIPNKTMLTYTEGMMKGGKDRGLKKAIQGFWLDILIGPFISFGVECDESSIRRDDNKNVEGLFQIYNQGTGAEQHRHHSTEISMYNVIEFMWDVETRKPYIMMEEHDIFSGLGDRSSPDDQISTKTNDEAISTSTKEKEKDTKGCASSYQTTSTCSVDEENQIKMKNVNNAVDGIKIIPMIEDELNSTSCRILKKKKYQNFFHHIHLSQQSAHLLGCEFFPSLLNNTKNDNVDGDKNSSTDNNYNSTVSVETGKFVFPLDKESLRIDMVNKILSLAQAQSLHLLSGQTEDIRELVELDTLCFQLRREQE